MSAFAKEICDLISQELGFPFGTGSGDKLRVGELDRGVNGIYVKMAQGAEPDRYTPIETKVLDFWAVNASTEQAEIDLRRIYDLFHQNYNYNTLNWQIYYSNALGNINDNDRDSAGNKLLTLTIQFTARNVNFDAASIGQQASSLTFLNLNDTPTSYDGQALKAVRVKSDESGLEFFTGSGLIEWGEIGGTLSNQTDLQAALDLKANKSITLTAGDGLSGGGDLSANRSFAVNVDDSTIEINSDTLRVKADGINDTHIDWGTGANQVSAVDVPIADADEIITAIEVEGALQENRTAINLNTTHRSSDGSDHTFIDQDVTSGSSPTFDGSDFTGIPDGALDETYALLAGRAGGQTLIGGIDASDTLTLQSTSNATKGKIVFGTSVYDEVNNRLGIGTNSPVQAVEVVGSVYANGGFFRTNSGLTNNSSSNNSLIRTLTTGTEIERNIADANPALIVQQLHASSTGNILQLENNGGSVFSVAQTGAITMSSTALVSNLNADKLDSQEGSYYLALGNATGILAAGNGGNLFDLDTETPLGTPLNSVYRIRHGFDNFLANAGMEHWYNGITSAPSGWVLQGDATIARSSTSKVGTYSAEITFGTANTGELYQAITIDTDVDYTFSCYVQRTSGSGNARLVAQEEGDDYTEYGSVSLPTDAGWNLVTLTVKPASSGSMRFAIKSADTTASVWLVDECMYEESKGVASTWTPLSLNDSDDMTIYGNLTFAGVIEVDNSLGVGTQTPLEKVQIGINDATDTYLAFQTNNNKNVGIRYYLTDGITVRGYMYWDTNEDIRIKGDAIHLDISGGNDAVIITEAGRVGIGLTPTSNMDGLSIESGLLTLKETATPTADANYGKVYTKNDNKLYFQSGDGVEHEVAFV